MIPFSTNPRYSEIKSWFRGRRLLADADVMALAKKIRPLTVVDGRPYYYLKVTSADQSLTDPAAVGARVQLAMTPYAQFYTFHRNNGTVIRPTLSEVFAGYEEAPYGGRDFCGISVQVLNNSVGITGGDGQSWRVGIATLYVPA